MLHDYQRKRVTIFLDPESDPLGAGYHISQSKIAIGSGGIFGKGFLNGSQSHLDYLPEGHTDFVFATMVEEWGLLGGAVPDPRLRRGDPLGHDASAPNARAASPSSPRPACRRRSSSTSSINLMMVMGLAPVVGIPAAVRQLRRLGGDDHDDLPRHADGARTQQRTTSSRLGSEARLEIAAVAPQFRPCYRPAAPADLTAGASASGMDA